MTRNRILMTCAIASLALGLSACSSDDKAPPVSQVTEMPDASMLAGMVVPTGTTIPLPADLLDDETFTAVEGETVSFDDVGVFMCLSATCSVVVADDEITTTGLIEVVSLADDLPAEVLTALAGVAEDPLTELATAQLAAANAATAAMTAAGTAKTSADDAYAARMNAATMQTNEESSGHAYMARHYAKMAEDERVKAEMASAAAAAAEDITTAVQERVKAEAAMAEAVAAEIEATKHAGLAKDAADDELFIVDTVKTVAGTSIDAAAGTNTRTVDGQTTKTGLLDSVMKAGFGMVAGTPLDADATPPTTYRQGVAARDLTIGKTVDSADDMARLMIVDRYAGTVSVKVYADAADAEDVTGTLTSDGRIDITPDNGNDDMFVTLKSAGMYYLAGDATANDGLTNMDMVAATTKATEVFYYVDDQGNMEPGDDETVYLVRSPVTSTDAEEVVTVTYKAVDIMAPAAPDGDDVDTDPDDTRVRASIPEATAYNHIHFGVWAALGEAAKTGEQDIAGLGIGFVQNFSGSGLTGADMPNNGICRHVQRQLGCRRACGGRGRQR